MPRRRRRKSRSSRGGPRWSSIGVTRAKDSGSGQTERIDRGTGLSKRDVGLYFDGSEKSRFHYNESSGAARKSWTFGVKR